MGTTLTTHRRPRQVNVAVDANALDRDGSEHDKLVDRLLEIGRIGIIKRAAWGADRNSASTHPAPDRRAWRPKSSRYKMEPRRAGGLMPRYEA
jgi:hypothetical protein